MFFCSGSEAKFVRLGALNIDNKTNTQDFDVIKIMTHPGYTGTYYNDIGLLRLNKKAKSTPYVRPACLYPNFKINPSISEISTGWGWDSTDLFKSSLQYTTFESCKKTFGIEPHFLDQGILDTIQVCAVPQSTNPDTCKVSSSLEQRLC